MSTRQGHILVVEDNADLIETLSFTLERDGFLIEQARNAREAYHALSCQSFDLILLDVMLPDESGFELCRTLREKKCNKDMPIVFLSAKSEEIDRVVGFEVGGDDYITKPFSVRELLLRINAILRRKKNSDVNNTKCSFGLLSLDLDTPQILVDGQEILLTSLELRLLYLLMTRRGRVQTREQLLQAVWKIDAEISTRTVDTHIKRLREKLLSAGSYIRTVRGIGYRFIGQEELELEAGSHSA